MVWVRHTENSSELTEQLLGIGRKFTCCLHLFLKLLLGWRPSLSGTYSKYFLVLCLIPHVFSLRHNEAETEEEHVSAERSSRELGEPSQKMVITFE